MKYFLTGTVVTAATSMTAHAQEVTIDLAGISSWDALGAPDNIVLTESLPAGSIVNGVTWTEIVSWSPVFKVLRRTACQSFIS